MAEVGGDALVADGPIGSAIFSSSTAVQVASGMPSGAAAPHVTDRLYHRSDTHQAILRRDPVRWERSPPDKYSPGWDECPLRSRTIGFGRWACRAIAFPKGRRTEPAAR